MKKMKNEGIKKIGDISLSYSDANKTKPNENPPKAIRNKIKSTNFFLKREIKNKIPKAKRIIPRFLPISGYISGK